MFLSAFLAPSCINLSKRIDFAGTETVTKWAGYFEGVIESGLQAATEKFQQRMKTKSKLYLNIFFFFFHLEQILVLSIKI